MQDMLLAYLMGGLERDERAEAEQMIASDPQLRTLLETLRRGLAPLEAERGEEEAPTGLAVRTSLRIREVIEVRQRRS